VVVVKGREGLALATDSRRVSVWRDRYLTEDDDVKLFSFAAPHNAVGAVLYGYGHGLRVAARKIMTFADGFEATLPPEPLPVCEFAGCLGRFLVDGSGFDLFVLIAAGYDPGASAGRVYVVEHPGRPTPLEHHAGAYGITWGGQRDFCDRLIQGYDARLGDVLAGVEGAADVRMAIPLATLTLGETADLATFLIRTTIDAARFITGLRAVGGPVVAATITRADGLRVAVARAMPGPTGEWVAVGEPSAAVLSVPADGIEPATYTVAQSAAGE